MFFPGIGQGRVTSNLQGAPVDDAVFVSDKEAVEMVRKLACLLTCIKYCWLACDVTVFQNKKLLNLFIL